MKIMNLFLFIKKMDERKAESGTGKFLVKAIAIAAYFNKLYLRDSL